MHSKCLELVFFFSLFSLLGVLIFVGFFFFFFFFPSYCVNRQGSAYPGMYMNLNLTESSGRTVLPLIVSQ